MITRKHRLQDGRPLEQRGFCQHFFDLQNGFRHLKQSCPRPGTARKRSRCGTGLLGGNGRPSPRHVRQQGSDGARHTKSRERHSPGARHANSPYAGQATATCRQTTGGAAAALVAAARRAAATARPPADAAAASSRTAAVDKAVARAVAAGRLAPRTPPRDAPAGAVLALAVPAVADVGPRGGARAPAPRGGAGAPEDGPHQSRAAPGDAGVHDRARPRGRVPRGLLEAEPVPAAAQGAVEVLYCELSLESTEYFLPTVVFRLSLEFDHLELLLGEVIRPTTCPGPGALLPRGERVRRHGERRERPLWSVGIILYGHKWMGRDLGLEDGPPAVEDGRPRPRREAASARWRGVTPRVL